MKLKNRLALTLVGTIALTVLIVAAFINFSFENYFEDYLRVERNMKFEKIVNDISSLLNPNAQYSLDELAWYLKLYSESESINVEVFDKAGNSVAKINSLEKKQNDDVDYIEKDYRFVQKNNTIGTMTLGYYDDSYISQRSQELHKNLMTSVIVIGCVAIVAIFFISLYFSRNLYNPIVQITNATKEIKNGNYDTEINDSDILEVQDLATNLKYLSGSIKSQERIRKEYAQDISHELRTPLTNLQLHLEAIKDDIIEPNPETIDLLLDEINRLNKLIDNLKASFNESSDIVTLVNSRFNLSQELISVLERLQPALAENHVLLESEIENNVHVYMDRDKIIQVMYNLLTNAVKAIEMNGRIKVTLKEFHTNIIITVRDNGIGIAEENLKHIFERFYRVDNARNTKVGGTGLGLSITKNIIDTMGGKIHVTSKLNSGTEFIVELPKMKL